MTPTRSRAQTGPGSPRYRLGAARGRDVLVWLAEPVRVSTNGRVHVVAFDLRLPLPAWLADHVDAVEEAA